VRIVNADGLEEPGLGPLEERRHSVEISSIHTKDAEDGIHGQRHASTVHSKGHPSRAFLIASFAEQHGNIQDRDCRSPEHRKPENEVWHALNRLQRERPEDFGRMVQGNGAQARTGPKSHD
jgi:hypothetical protein